MISLRKIVAPLCIALWFVSAGTMATPTPSDYGALPTTQMVAISPDGNLIAYRKVTDKQDAVIVSSISEKKTVFAIDVSKLQPRDIYFFNNKQIMLRASQYTRVDGFLGKFDLSTAYVLNVEDKKFRQLLIPGDVILAGQSGLGSILGVSPDGNYAYMPAWSDINNVVPESVYELYKVDLNKKSVTRASSGGTYFKDWFLDGSGDVIAKEEFHEKNNIHRIIAKHDGKWVDIYKENTSIRNKSFVGVTADFKSLVFLERNQKTGHSTYNLMSLADGAITSSILAREDADIDDVIVNLQRVVFGVRYAGLTPSYKFFDSDIDQKVNSIVAQFPEHSVWLTSWSPDWKSIVVNVEGSNYAGDYFLFSSGQKPLFLTSSYPQIKSEDINPIGKVTLAARDGLKIPTLITIPKSKVGEMKNLPAVVLPHGGPASHDTIGFDFFAQALASQGYLVIQPQFRGSTGFGNKHRDAGFGEWGKKMQDDVTDSVKFFAAKGMIDPARVCIVGGSYGGYTALAGGAFTPELYKCVVSINGVSDINSFLTYEKNHNGKDSEIANYWEMQLASGDIDKDELSKISPAKSANRFNAPVLLIHADDDKTVLIEQSQTMRSALTSAQKSVQFVTLENESHQLLKGPTRTKAVDEMIKFVNKNLQ